ncbi:MAG: HD domain-containing protein [Candidatus Acetothermia bacterium]|jgi:putative nucleotidyltransferase with HDIG domain|nr:HD domain-containing protein [Candidatus Acetothermia bacterium]MDH7505927.1 HD domain-containing protein [Candidatus Acetothermia bacterium]
MEGLERLLPELKEIREPKLREGVLRAWELALERGGWQAAELEQIPFTLLTPTKVSLVEHTRRVTRMALAAARERADLNLDHVIAGGLLHDVGKLLEYEHQGGAFRKARAGELVRHPVSGFALALEAGLPLEVAHIILAHSEEGEKLKRTPEAILIHHCDFIDFEIAKGKEAK